LLAQISNKLYVVTHYIFPEYPFPNPVTVDSIAAIPTQPFTSQGQLIRGELEQRKRELATTTLVYDKTRDELTSLRSTVKRLLDVVKKDTTSSLEDNSVDTCFLQWVDRQVQKWSKKNT